MDFYFIFFLGKEKEKKNYPKELSLVEMLLLEFDLPLRKELTA